MGPLWRPEASLSLVGRGWRGNMVEAHFSRLVGNSIPAGHYRNSTASLSDTLGGAEGILPG
jgi:hypothetical protein